MSAGSQQKNRKLDNDTMSHNGNIEMTLQSEETTLRQPTENNEHTESTFHTSKDLPKMSLKTICISLMPILFIISIIISGVVVYILSNNDNAIHKFTPTAKPTLPPTRDEKELPIPGVPFKFENGTLTLSESVKYMKNDTSLKCIMESDSFGNLKNTSYIQINKHILPDIEIGSILVVDKYLFDILPENCTQFPAFKVWDIEESNSIMTFHVKGAKFWEYIPEMDVGVNNVSMFDLGYVNPGNRTMEKINELAQKYNLSNVSSTIFEIQCWNMSRNGKRLNRIETVDGLCGGVSVMDKYGGVYGDGFGSFNVSNSTSRRRMLFGFCDWVAETVDLIVSIVSGDIDKRVVEVGLKLYNNIKYQISAKQELYKSTDEKLKINVLGEFTLDAGIDFFTGVYADLQAKYQIWSFNPSFDYFRFVVGAETRFEAYLNAAIKGGISITYEIAKKEKRKVFFIGPVPLEVNMYAALEVGLDVTIEISVSARAGYEPIFVEFGVEYDPSKGGWNSVSDKNLEFKPFKQWGGSLGNSTCLKLSIVPSITLKFGIVFYELIDISLSFPFKLNTDLTWPDTCDDDIDECVHNPPQLKFSMQFKFGVAVGLEVGFGSIGLPTIGKEWELFSLPIGHPIEHCTGLWLPMPIYKFCCPLSDITANPTKLPTPSPTFSPTSSPIPSPTLSPTGPPVIFELNAVSCDKQIYQEYVNGTVSGDPRYYQLTLNSTQDVFFSTCGSDFDTKLRVRDENMNSL
eukprot:347193_1